MNADLQILQTVLAFAAVVLLCLLLKKLDLVREEHGPLFANLLTEGALPVVIFSQLATHPIAGSQLLLVLAMLGSIIICLVLTWAAGALLKLERQNLGALMMTAAFGSSTLIGYPLIQYAFPGDPEALTNAVLISELGVGLPIFTLCIAVAIHFGECHGRGSRLPHGLFALLPLSHFRGRGRRLASLPVPPEPEAAVSGAIFSRPFA